MNFLKIFTDGGMVMYPLLAASMLVVTLAIERLYFWSQIGGRQQQTIRVVLDLYQSQSPLVIERLDRARDLPIIRIFIAAISLNDATPEEFRLAMENQAHAEIPILRRFNNVFDTVISLAPLFGLLGTIIGLISSFSSLKVGQANSGGNVAAGIGEALIATASGLIVAILASICANLFRGLYQRQLTQIQESTGHLELLHRRQWEKRANKSHDSRSADLPMVAEF
jgi:biopolymer transport protein ExbB